MRVGSGAEMGGRVGLGTDDGGGGGGSICSRGGEWRRPTRRRMEGCLDHWRGEALTRRAPFRFAWLRLRAMNGRFCQRAARSFYMGLASVDVVRWHVCVYQVYWYVCLLPRHSDHVHLTDHLIDFMS